MWGMTLPAILGRWALFGGLFLLIGSWGMRGLVHRGTRVVPEAEPVVAGAARQAALAGGILALAGVLLRLLFQLLDFAEPREPLGPQLRYLVVGSVWGRVWSVQLAAAILALALFPGWMRDAAGGGRLAAGGLLLGALVLTQALSGHAAGNPLGVAADAVHFFSGGLWLGTLAVLLLTAFRLGEARDRSVRGWAPPFHRLATLCVAGVIVTGAVSAGLILRPADAQLQSGWGFALILKLAAVAIVLAMGWRAGWRTGPRLAEEGVPARWLEGAVLELVAAQLVLVATALLVALSPLAEEHHTSL